MIRRMAIQLLTIIINIKKIPISNKHYKNCNKHTIIYRYTHRRCHPALSTGAGATGDLLQET